MILYESKNFSVQNFVLICAKDLQVVRFVIFDEVLESISCFVINGDNRFDPYRVHQLSPIDIRVSTVNKNLD